MNWRQWIPDRKVTAGAVAAALAFVIVWFVDVLHELTVSETFAMGSAVAVLVAYLVPNRDGGG